MSPLGIHSREYPSHNEGPGLGLPASMHSAGRIRWEHCPGGRPSQDVVPLRICHERWM